MMHSLAVDQMMGAMDGDETYQRLGRVATNAGMTATGDLASTAVMDPSTVEVAERVVNGEGLPLRIPQYPPATRGGDPAADDVIDAVRRLLARRSRPHAEPPQGHGVRCGSSPGTKR